MVKCCVGFACRPVNLPLSMSNIVSPLNQTEKEHYRILFILKGCIFKIEKYTILLWICNGIHSDREFKYNCKTNLKPFTLIIKLLFSKQKISQCYRFNF